VRKRHRQALVSSLAFGAALCFASAAQANGRIPASSSLIISPTDPNLMVARVTFGVLLSKDAGKTWDWVCETAIGYSGPEDPAYALFGDGTLMGSLADGLSVSHDSACSFALKEKGFFIDVAVPKSTPSRGVAFMSGYENSDADGGLVFNSQVFESTDNGKAWTLRGKRLDGTLLGETIDVTETNPNRVYISAIRGSGATVKGVLLVSDNRGDTFTERVIPLQNPDERAPFIAAVDPKNADRLYVRTTAAPDKPARLIVSDDAGKTWSTKFSALGTLLGFALSDDGSTVYVGGPKDGLHQASTKDFQFKKKSNIQIQCLALKGAALWACCNEASGFVLGESADQGETFTARLHLNQVRGPLACPPGTPTKDKCESDWPRQARELAINVGGTDGGTDAAAPAPSASVGAADGAQAGGGGCVTTQRPAARLYVPLAGLAASVALWLLRRRKPR